MRVIISLSGKTKGKHDSIKVLKDAPADKKKNQPPVEDEETPEDTEQEQEQQDTDTSAEEEAAADDTSQDAPPEDAETAQEDSEEASAEESETPPDEQDADPDASPDDAPATEDAPAPAEESKPKPTTKTKDVASPVPEEAEETPKTQAVPNAQKPADKKDAVGVVKDYGKPTTPKFFTQTPVALELTNVGRVTSRLFNGVLPATSLRYVRYCKVDSGYELSYQGFVVTLTDEDAHGGTQPPCFESAEDFIRVIRLYGAQPGISKARTNGSIDDKPKSK